MQTPYFWLGADAEAVACDWLSYQQLLREAEIVEEQDYE